MVKNFNNIEGNATRKPTPKNPQNAKTQTTKIQYLNFGETDQMEIEGFGVSELKSRIVWIFYILTFGLLRLFFHWYPHFKLQSTHSRCDLKEAQKVLITDNYKGKYRSYFVKDIIQLSISSESGKLLDFYLNDGTRKRVSKTRIIRCKKLTYIWDEERLKFIKLAGLDTGIPRNLLHQFPGFNRTEQDLRRIIYGFNEILVPVQTLLTLLVLEALTPFYIFQVFSLIVWFCEYYYYYTIAIIVMSVFGISTSIIQTRKNQQNLKGTVHSSEKAMVSRGNNVYEEVPTSELVPGDIILIPKNGCAMECDAILLNGNCVVNESMLTGESVPVTKTPLPKNSTPYNVKEDINHTLYCGTKIIQTRHYDDRKILALVIRTGYLTTKGELVRSILYPPPADFKFDQDSYKFIGILSFIATVGFIYTIVSKSSRNIAPVDILIKALDLITVAVPPALPAAMTVGKLYALNRLKNHKISCINSRVINVSGSIDCVCFDKTGTLTEDELDMWAVVPVLDQIIKPPISDIQNLPEDWLLIRAMATCHSLTQIDEQLCGDPLDVKMFQSTNWALKNGHLVSPRTQNFQIQILKQFQFSSHLQRMTVITKSTDRTTLDVFCKGSPEMIMSLCQTIPQETHSWLKNYTEQGYRVIAIATKTIHNLTNDESREDIENNLNFLGLIILENKLKPETPNVIKELKLAALKIVMITGDNIQTAMHVAKECGIINKQSTIIEVIAEKPTKIEFASLVYHLVGMPKTQITKNGVCDLEMEKDYQFVMTGHSWGNLVQYFPDQVSKIVVKGVLFARMSGVQKQQLVEELKILGYYVAMCGDGANDCGALKAAHVGISLSEAESSVASPFTSQEPNISCVPKVIKEGRAALVTCFGVFKIMVCYSLTEFASVIIMYTIDTNLTSMQYLFIDICLILNFSSIFGLTKAYGVLDRRPPMTSLLSFIPLCSLVAFMFTTVIYQVFAFHFIQTYSWFTPFTFNSSNTVFYECYENYAVYSVSMFQYITMAVVFSKGKPYRQPIITNKLLIFSIIAMILVCSYIVVFPAEWLRELFELKIPPFYDARYTFLFIALVNFFTCFILEDLFVEIILRNLVQKLHNSQPTYVRLLEDRTFPMKNEVILETYGVVNEGYQNEETVTTRC